MNPVFQFIAATLIVVLTLGFTLYAVASSSDVQLMTYSQLQLEPVANSLMQNFVLSPGSPVNWGSNVSLSYNQLASFGLATNPQTGVAYSLDVAKLDRILNNSFVANYLYIPPTTVGELLGIYEGGHFNYGFDFRMVPALNITISNISTTTPLYAINVTDFQGRPAINAQLNVSEFSFCVVTKGGSTSPTSYNATYTTAYNITNLAGAATVSLSQPPLGCQAQNGSGGKGGGNGGNGNGVESVDILIASASYYGMSYQNFLQTNSVCKAQMIIEGQYLVANFTGKSGVSQPNCAFVSQNNGSGKIETTVFEVTSKLNVILDPSTECPSSKPPCNLINHGAFNYTVFSLSHPIDPDVILAGIIFTTNGKQYFVIASNPTTPTGIIEYTSNSLTTVSSDTGHGLGLASVPAAVTVSRYVTVGTDTWFASLTIWRMGQ